MLRQSMLPGLPDGAVKVGRTVSVLTKEDNVTYFAGSDNYFSHPAADERGRRLALTSLIGNGHVRARDVEEVLHIPHRTVMNWMKQYRSEGPASFYRPPQSSKPTVMTADKSLECAQLLAEGYSMAEVARRTSVQESTLRKAYKRKVIPQLAAIAAAEGEKKTPPARKANVAGKMPRRRTPSVRPALARMNG